MFQSRDVMHPLAVLVYAGSLFFAALAFSHPFYLAALGLVTIVNFFAFRGFTSLFKYLKLTLWFSVLFVIVNIAVCRTGRTALWESPAFWFGARIDISLEEIWYNLNMCFRILLMTSVFCLYLVLQDTDRALSFFSRAAPHSALTLVLTNLLIPHVSDRMRTAREVLLARGADLDRGNFRRRIEAHIPILKIALHASLESSFEMQEALFARGYAAGPRSHFQWFRWGWRDSAALASGVLTFGFTFLSLVHNQGAFTFYPALSPLLQSVNFVTLALIVIVCSVVPVTRAFFDDVIVRHSARIRTDASSGGRDSSQ